MNSVSQSIFILLYTEMEPAMRLIKWEYLDYPKDPEERENWFRITTRNNIPDHSHRKQKDSMKTQALLKDILVWTWNTWVGHRQNTSKQREMVASMKNCLVNMTLRLFYQFFVVMTMVPALLKQFRGSPEIKKITTNAPGVL